MIGSGILQQPECFMKAGIILTLVLYIILCCLIHFTATILIATAERGRNLDMSLLFPSHFSLYIFIFISLSLYREIHTYIYIHESDSLLFIINYSANL